MDDQINNFLTEIDEIAPLTKPESEVWKQCFDELNGIPYYWNKNTHEVTWTPPGQNKSNSVPVPMKNVNDVEVKKENSKKLHSRRKSQNKSVVQSKRKHESESEDEKITLISSYGTDSSEEDTEAPPPKINKKLQESPLPSASVSKIDEDEEDIDILAQIQKRAQELKELGGDIPPEVQSVMETTTNELLKTKQTISGVSLVAGYSDSEDDNETDVAEKSETPNVFPIAQPHTVFPINKPDLPENQPVIQPEISHSTLFPITQPININDFSSPQKKDVEVASNVPDSKSGLSPFDNRAFHRKRRIGVTLVNTAKRNIENSVMTEENEDIGEEEPRKGFGYSNNGTAPVGAIFPGAIAFVKSDTLNPSDDTISDSNSPKASVTKEENNSELNKSNEEMYNTLKEKLLFLNEGRTEISPVQMMIIQADTLFDANKAGALEFSYLHKWLTTTCADLVKLEKEATPPGWRLEWDKSTKRYYYHNILTSQSQWEYPQPDSIVQDVAMDISTTPPHPSQIQGASLPSSPNGSPIPPPPPVISAFGEEILLQASETTRRLIETVPQPPPPGVDGTEIDSSSKANNNNNNALSDSLTSELDSFYSDIAAIGSSPPPPPPPPAVENASTSKESTNVEKSEMPKKQKKNKVKLSPCLAMKKKGIPKMVEKWKNVDYY